MSTKVKRTPLFGHDGNLGIPIIPRDTKVRAPEMRRTRESWDSILNKKLLSFGFVLFRC